MVAETGVICIIHIIIIRLLMKWRQGINHNQVVFAVNNVESSAS